MLQIYKYSLHPPEIYPGTKEEMINYITITVYIHHIPSILTPYSPRKNFYFFFKYPHSLYWHAQKRLREKKKRRGKKRALYINKHSTEQWEHEHKPIFSPPPSLCGISHSRMETHIKAHCFENNTLEICSDLSSPPRILLWKSGEQP